MPTPEPGIAGLNRELIYNPLELEDDPYPIYRRLREEAPVYVGETDTERFWALSRFDDVDAAALDWKTFSSAEGNDLDDTGLLFGPAPAMDLADPPVHTRARNALRKDFAPGPARTTLEPQIRTKVRELVAGLMQHETFDFAELVSYPLPAALICGWLGFPEEDHGQLRQWHEVMLQRDSGKTELPQQAIQARDEMWEYLRKALADREANGRNDLLTVLARARQQGGLSTDEALANALFLFDAGIVSTSATISSALLHMNRFRDQWHLLRESPGIIPSAVEEFLRFDAPFQWFTRVTTREVEVRGVTIPQGERVVLIWASANRDERRWTEADRLLLERPVQRHLSFSAGVHRCLGSPVARLELQVLFEELLPVLADYEISEPVVRRITPSERTIVHLPVTAKWVR